ncbi:DUF3885 domain-containing protein [Streptomyces pseudogriseolus]|uniref:DUF3885 domain-containing protein n=1 Tax=Streptomyces pseudogriseolus TaxID=36817 RepID=UPI0009980E08
MRRLYHPYDGGADVFLTSPEERDRMRDRHADWLSSHPLGFLRGRAPTPRPGPARSGPPSTHQPVPDLDWTNLLTHVSLTP